MTIEENTLAYLRQRYGVIPNLVRLEDRVADKELLATLLAEGDEGDWIEIGLDPFTLTIHNQAGMDWEWTVNVFKDGMCYQEIEHYTLPEALDMADEHMRLLDKG